MDQEGVILILQRIQRGPGSRLWVPGRSAQNSSGLESLRMTPGKKRFCYPFIVPAIFCALVRMNA